MMKCGHSPNGKDAVTGNPVCVICGCDEVTDDPYLSNREAKCLLCNERQPSDTNLPFFEYKPNREYDGFYCGCRGYD